MKYDCRLQINVPPEKLAPLFADRERMAQWQEGLLRSEVLEGEPWTKGCKTRLFFRSGASEITMDEEVTDAELPGTISFLYTMKGAENHCINRFLPDGEGGTLWEQQNMFRLRGLGFFMGLFFPGSFRRQTLSDMEKFRDYVQGLSG